MQTLRKRNSPCKYKNDPSRFLGEGMSFKAKLIGILEVNEARGDKMCQEALNDLKMAIRAAGEHKQRITISIAIDGLRLRDEKSGDCMYHHPVHKISFIAQDMSDSRAFGYIFGSPDTGHRFFGIKTDKTASQVVIAMRDLFQVVFELKKKEIEMAKHHIEQHQNKFGSTSTKDESETTKSKGKLPITIQHKETTVAAASENNNMSISNNKNTSEAIADLLDLEDELNNIQQGINQMERITPSDPFGPLGKPETFLDPFDDNFQPPAPKPEPNFNLPLVPGSKIPKTRSLSQTSNKEEDKPKGLFNSVASSSKTNLFASSSKESEEVHWFDKETECLFSDTATTRPDSSSPLTYHTPTAEPDKAIGDDGKSPAKVDVFTDLDPLGTGKVKPYVDKKDFFQDLKNPPKKVLKDLLEETKPDSIPYFPSEFDPTVDKNSGTSSSQPKETTPVPRYSKLDPFEDNDPFDKSDPFSAEDFPSSIGFPPFESVFQEEEKPKEEFKFTSLPLRGSLRVSLPPEKVEPISISSITVKSKFSPDSPDELETFRKKFPPIHQNDDLKHIPSLYDDKLKAIQERKSHFKDKFSSQSSPTFRGRDTLKKLSTSSAENSDTTPEPPPKFTSALFSIKPPPLPPKKQNFMMNFRPPARPPSLEESSSHYDYIKNKEESPPSKILNIKETTKSPKSKLTETPEKKPKRESRGLSFPVLPPPPQRKNEIKSTVTPLRETAINSPKRAPKPKEAVLNITLNQLDQVGLRTLAETLGIPAENVFKMTLQELTKLLADQQASSSHTIRQEDNFEADFQANFDQFDENEKIKQQSEDKYAALKELIENEKSSFELETNVSQEEIEMFPEEQLPISKTTTEEESRVAQTVAEEKQEAARLTEEEDRYAALRQLSICTQKSDNLSEDLDVSNEDDSSARADQIDLQSTTQEPSEDLLPSLTSKEEPDIMKAIDDWSKKDFDKRGDFTPEKEDWIKTNVVSNKKEEDLFGKQDNWFKPEPDKNKGKDLFRKNEDWAKPESIVAKPEGEDLFAKQEHWDTSTPVKQEEEDLFHKIDKSDKIPGANEVQDTNWASFDKSPKLGKVTSDNISDRVNDAETSPVSSDGKEETSRKMFDWKKAKTRPKARYDVPWLDEDESWDEYSPKESYWSDESSHDDHSPSRKHFDRYKRQWRTHPRVTKPGGWDHQWHRRRRSRDETEDEYEDSWRGYGNRIPPYDTELRKRGSREILEYDEYRDKRVPWCDERKEPLSWEDTERDRRKRSESDEDYRRRCGSETPDREYDWKFKRDNYGYPDKQKQYYMTEGRGEFRYADHCHERLPNEARSKHKKVTHQKRPSSASETKRNNYDKIYSPVDHKPRQLFSPKREFEPDFSPRYHTPASHRDPRFHYDPDPDRYYSSFDRRGHGRRTNRGVKRNETIGPMPKSDEKYASFTQEKEEIPEKLKPHYLYQQDSVEEDKEIPKEAQRIYEGRKSMSAQFQFEDDFSPSYGNGSVDSPINRTPRSEESPSPRRKWLSNHETWTDRSKSASTGDDASYSIDNNNDNFATFHNDRATTGKPSDNFQLPKPSLLKSKHTNLGRQDSSASLRKSESINIFSRENDPFENDDFFNTVSPNNSKLNRYTSEKSKSNSNVSDPFTWKQVFGRDQV